MATITEGERVYMVLLGRPWGVLHVTSRSKEFTTWFEEVPPP